MFKTIVVGTDGSETADRAVERTAELARLTGARVHVVSAWAPVHLRVGGGNPAEADEWALSSDSQVDGVLQRTMARLRGEGLDSNDHAPRGDPADGIVEVAKREEADLIVLGSMGMRGKRRLLGSVPNKVSHHAPCDVLIVQTG